MFSSFFIHYGHQFGVHFLNEKLIKFMLLIKIDLFALVLTGFNNFVNVMELKLLF